MKTEFIYQFGQTATNVTIERNNDHFQITIGGNRYSVTIHQDGSDALHLEIDGQRLHAYVAHQNSYRYVAVGGQVWKLERATPAQNQRRRPGAEAGAGSGCLEATMPGLVLDVLAAKGDTVERGQTLVLLEAMKMELRITAPFAGQVRQIHCQAGQVVERGQLLVEIAPSEK